MKAEYRPPTPDEITEKIDQNNVDWQYLALLRDILENGTESTDRTGTGTKKVFGRTIQIDLADGYPLITTKKLPFRVIKEELLFFIKGERNLRSLALKDVHIWDEWPFQKYLEANGWEKKYLKYTPAWRFEKTVFVERIKDDEKFAQKWGDLGPIYGYQWRHWRTRDGREIDQLANAVEAVKHTPHDRGIIVTAWNPEDLEEMVLRPCHMFFQFQVAGNKLNCAMDQRSVDTLLGLPFNIASYALMTEIMAKISGKEPGQLTLFLGDTHLYLNHLDAAKLMLTREPKPLPKLILDPINDIDNISSQAIRIEGYKPHDPIKVQISV